MSSGEIAYRVQQKLISRLQRSGLLTAAEPPVPDFSAIVGQFVRPEGVDIAPGSYTDAADKIMAGQLRIFIHDYDSGNLQWNKDPKTGTLVPLTFGKALDYRNEKLVGDIKYLWEPNRHLQLVTLTQAYRLSGERKYLDGFVTQLSSWIDQCPYLLGPNWTSSLELGIRLINWSICWQLIGNIDSSAFKGKEGQAFLKRWLNSIYQHMYFVRGHFSRYSSANNHLIGEAAGLFVATMTWPFWSVTKKWGRVAKDILEREALLQNGPDGVNREQAISYQQFVLDFLVISELAGRANTQGFSSDYLKRIELMMEYVASIMDVGGNVPMIGDADDGYAVRLSTEQDFCPYRSLLATGTVLFNRADFKAKANKFDDKIRWLLGNEAEKQFLAITLNNVRLPVRRTFTEGGYYILGCDFESEKEIRLVVDAGPLGYQAIAAHGHADALAVWLSVAGKEFLIDPGTYAYHTMKKWRDYFRGTTAHNTIVVDSENQSEISGNFMWLRHAKAECTLWEQRPKSDRFVGKHDGYLVLPDPVEHQREVMLDKVSKSIDIIDELTCKTSHTVECYWHFSESCVVTVDENGVIEAKNGDEQVKLSPGEGSVECRVLRGQENPPGGWISRSFDSKIETTTVIWKRTIVGALRIKTRIQCFFP